MEQPKGPGASSGRKIDELIPLVYDRLRRLARAHLKNESAGISLRPTDLVHETYVALTQVQRIEWVGKTHFFAVAARQMRRVLVSHARKRRANKRGGKLEIVPIQEDVFAGEGDSLEVLALEQAIERLEKVHHRLVLVAELRLFAGLKYDEIAEELGLSSRTVQDDWRFIRASLARDLGKAHRPK